MKYNSKLFISAAMTLKGCVLEQFQSKEINTTITHMGLPFMLHGEDNIQFNLDDKTQKTHHTVNITPINAM